MRRPLPTTIAAMALALALQPRPGPGAGLPWPDGTRVAFLGDSITQVGLFIEDIEAYLFTRFPGRRYEIINLGLSGETASGVTEPGDPYRRPTVRERLGRALELARPDLVVVCYGMNDGIYHPPDPGRLAAYRRGIEEVVRRAERAGAEVVLATPPPFDPSPISDRLRPVDAGKFDYDHPFEGYDGVLQEYGRWLLSKRLDGWKVVDVHGEVERFVDSARGRDPGFTVTPDGVHPDATGHWLIARAFLEAWGAPGEVDSATIDAGTLKATAGEVDAIARDGRSLAFSWTTRIPMPHDPRWDARLADGDSVDGRFNRQRVAVTGLSGPRDGPLARYWLLEGGRKVRSVGVEGLGAIELDGYRELSTHRRAASLRILVAERQGLLAPAWLEAVGHKSSGHPKGPPLDVARKRAGALEARIRELARPRPITLRLEPRAAE